MATFNSTQCLDLLGKTIHLVEHVRHPDLVLDFPHRGQVVAVVVPLPGSSVAPSLLLDDGESKEYYDLDACTLVAVIQ